LSIRIFYDEAGFRYKGWNKTRKIIENIITGEGKAAGHINFIITTDANLILINRQFLEHDYYTDVITFNYNEGSYINGEIYISADTVKDNAGIYGTDVMDEMKRVMIHGVLHLAGHDDRTEEEKSKMRKLEDFWLAEGGS
jgi:rRNA maturation RNase YbeY